MDIASSVCRQVIWSSGQSREDGPGYLTSGQEQGKGTGMGLNAENQDLASSPGSLVLNLF